MLPILAAGLLADAPVEIGNVPHLHDVTTMMELLGQMGVDLAIDDKMRVHIDSRRTHRHVAPYELVKTMRASILVLGPLVARFGQAEVSLPGGCAIGSRPVNLHIKGLQALGAEVTVENGYIRAKAGRLKGARIVFDLVTVTGTEKHHDGGGAGAGHHGDRERRAGARSRRPRQLPQQIRRQDPRRGHQHHRGGRRRTPRRRLLRSTARPHRNRHLPRRRRHDRRPRGVPPHARRTRSTPCSPSSRKAGAHIVATEDSIELDMRGKRPRAVDLTTAPYPAFPTDMQAQFMALNFGGRGRGHHHRKPSSRTASMHVQELQRLGADIRVEGNTAVVRGSDKLSGAPIMATDPACVRRRWCWRACVRTARRRWIACITSTAGTRTSRRSWVGWGARIRRLPANA